MKQLLFLIGCLCILSSCSKMEVDSEKFIEDALNGIVLIDHHDVYKKVHLVIAPRSL